jgi:hypothetical protein
MRLARSCTGRGAVGEKTDQHEGQKFSACVTALYAVRESKNFESASERLDATTQRGEHSPAVFWGSLQRVDNGVGDL